MPRHVLVAVLLLALPLAGCLSPSSAATIPQDALDDQGWREKDQNEAEFLRGAVKVHIHEYEPRPSLVQLDFGGIHVVTTSAVPVLDESNFIEPLLEKILENEGVSLGERTRERFRTADAGSVVSTVYAVEGAPSDAQLRIVPIACEDANVFVAGIGWATSGHFKDVGNLLGSVPCPE